MVWWGREESGLTLCIGVLLARLVAGLENDLGLFLICVSHELLEDSSVVWCCEESSEPVVLEVRVRTLERTEGWAGVVLYDSAR